MSWLSRQPLLARRALIGAAGLTVLMAVTWLLEFHFGRVQRLDAAIYRGFLGLRVRPHVTRVATLIANLCDPTPYVYLCAIPVAIALVRRRFLLAAVIVAILLGANFTTEVLKPLLAAPRPSGLPTKLVAVGSWPSGHATAAMSLALCVVLACPARLRPWAAALGAAFAVAVVFSFLTLGWHYPSDAFGGFLVASIWALLGIAVFATLDARLRHGREISPARSPGRLAVGDALAPSAVVVGVALLVLAMVLVARPQPVLDYFHAHQSFVAGAVALGALALSLATGVVMTLRR